MDKAFSDVLEFHRVLVPEQIGTTPAIVPYEVEELRRGLHKEEYDELNMAILNDDLPGIAKESADLIYVVLGTCIAYGIALPEVWRAVHASNMAKQGGPIRPDGKRLKPDGWTHPDIAGMLSRQEPIR